MTLPERPRQKSLWWPVCTAFGLAALAGGLSNSIAPTDGSASDPTPIPDAPQRIVSTVLSSDEILMDLGLGGRLVAVGQFASDPKSSHVHARVGPNYQIVTADAEAIVSLEPDLVFVSAFARPETRTMLIRVGVPLSPLATCTNFACIANSIEELGQTVQRPEAAATLILEMNHRLERLETVSCGKESSLGAFVPAGRVHRRIGNPLRCHGGARSW